MITDKKMQEVIGELITLANNEIKLSRDQQLNVIDLIIERRAQDQPHLSIEKILRDLTANIQRSESPIAYISILDKYDLIEQKEQKIFALKIKLIADVELKLSEQKHINPAEYERYIEPLFKLPLNQKLELFNQSEIKEKLNRATTILSRYRTLVNIYLKSSGEKKEKTNYLLEKIRHKIKTEVHQIYSEISTDIKNQQIRSSRKERSGLRMLAKNAETKKEIDYLMLLGGNKTNARSWENGCIDFSKIPSTRELYIDLLIKKIKDKKTLTESEFYSFINILTNTIVEKSPNKNKNAIREKLIKDLSHNRNLDHILLKLKNLGVLKKETHKKFFEGQKERIAKNIKSKKK